MEVVSNTPDDEESSREKMAVEMATEPIRSSQTSVSEMEKSSVNISLL